MGGPLHRCDEAFAGREVPERSRCPEAAVIGDPLATFDADREVRSLRAGDPHLAAGRQRPCQIARAAPNLLVIRRHRPVQHVLGDLGHRRNANPALVRLLACGGMRDGLRGGRDTQVASQHRGGRCRGRLGAVRLALAHLDQEGLRTHLASPRHQRLRDRTSLRIRQHQERLAGPQPQAVDQDGVDGVVQESAPMICSNNRHEGSYRRGGRLSSRGMIVTSRPSPAATARA